MREVVVLTVGIIEHLETIKNANLKNILSVLDNVSLSPDDRKILRKSILDNFNGYARIVNVQMEHINKIIRDG